MPELHTFVIFAAASAAFLAVPGPSVIYIVSRSLAEGRTAGDRVGARDPGRRPRPRDRRDDRGVGAAGLLGDGVQRRQVRGRGVPDLPRDPAAARRRRARGRARPARPVPHSSCSGRASSSTASTRRRHCSSSPSCRSSSIPTAARSRRRCSRSACCSSCSRRSATRPTRSSRAACAAALGERRRTLARVSGCQLLGVGLARGAVAGVELERARVDAVAQAARVARAVVEDVAEVAAAAAADDLGAAHEQRVVRARLDRGGDGRLGEARPAGAGVELGVGANSSAPQPAQR